MIYYRVPVFRPTLALRVVSPAETNEQLFCKFITPFSAAFSNYNGHCSSRSVLDTVDSRVADNLFIRNLYAYLRCQWAQHDQAKLLTLLQTPVHASPTLMNEVQKTSPGGLLVGQQNDLLSSPYFPPNISSSVQ
ncbi:hypothetical protein CEXT_214721 [Caerostris extrusa]|uniref:Uncharacterized protein n=1 Tax=Caerostris extrusa TaxID=172846 RepID=A0AAV4VXU3_CAEEX|nr:hypothetical protein CEXT_214721 [Caerostris extrusa]